MTIRFNIVPTASTLYINACIAHGKPTRYKSLEYNLPATKSKDGYKFWNAEKNRARIHEDAEDINAKIDLWSSRFRDYKAKCRRGEVEFDFDDALALLDGKAAVSRTKSKYLIEVANLFYQNQLTITKDSSAKPYKTMIEDLTGFQDYEKKKFRLLDVNVSFYQKFGLYLIDENENINNTINKKISRVSTMMEWAFTNGFIDVQLYKNKFAFKGHKSSRFPLNENEVQALTQYRPETDFQKVVLDAFLFCCETGLRLSDIKLLKSYHIKKFQDDETTLMYLDFTEEKTVDTTFVPLSNRALDILAKYPASGNIFKFKHGQSANRELKDMAEDAKLNRVIEVVYTQGSETHKIPYHLREIISFHWARNTYITLLLARGANPVYVQDNAGHADLKTTMGYSKQDDVKRWKETLKIQNKQLS